jgi:hypothetical protein
MSDRDAAVAMRDDEPTIVPDRASAPPRRVLAVLATLMGFASISTDLYLPAMGRALGADAGAMELTVSGFLIGFSLGQLLWGAIGDRFGRRGPIAVGLVLFVLGSIGCTTAAGASVVIARRILQAIGASAGVVLGRAKGGTPRVVATHMWGRDEEETLAEPDAWDQPIHRIRWLGPAKAFLQIRPTAIAHDMRRALSILAVAA